MNVSALDAAFIKMAAIDSRRSWCKVSGVVLLFTVHLAAFPRDNPPNRYPEKGKVVAVRITEHTEYAPVSPADSKGRTQGGQAYVYRNWVYRVQTDDGFYELEGGKKRSMAVGDVVEFRIEKGTGRVRTGNKEKKYLIISNSPTSAK
jgi:hypothetical protein